MFFLCVKLGQSFVNVIMMCKILYILIIHKDSSLGTLTATI